MADIEVHRWATWACSTKFLTATAGDGRSPRRVAFSTPPERGVEWRPGVVWKDVSESMLEVEDIIGNSRAVTPVCMCVDKEGWWG